MKAKDSGSREASSPEALIGALSLEQWQGQGVSSSEEPWLLLREAHDAVRKGLMLRAQELWTSIARDGNNESLVRLQAWHFLRSTGIRPGKEDANQVLAAAAELAIRRGHDRIVAYADGSVRYLNHSLHGLVVALDAGALGSEPARRCRFLLDRAVALTGVLKPWRKEELPPLAAGESRFMILTPSGPMFGQGLDRALRADRVAGPLLSQAQTLAVDLMNA